MMKAVAKAYPSIGLTPIEAQEPDIQEDDDVIVEVISASICGTDMHIYEWDEWAQSKMKLPRIVGHEMVGRVAKIGRNVKNLDIGDIVIGESHIPCQICYYCKTGRMHLCKNLKLLGITTDGCFAEYCKTKEIALWKLNSKINPEHASIFEPLGNAVHSIFETNPSNKDIIVYGCGPIGLATIFFLKKLGASKVIGIDISNYRLNFAKKFGADKVINAKEENIEEIVSSEFPEGADILFEMSGAKEAYKKGLKLLKAGATVILLGIPSGNVEVNVSGDIILKEVQLKGIFGRKMFETWYELEKLINEVGFPFEDFITQKFSIFDFDKAFETMKSGNCIKIVLKPS